MTKHFGFDCNDDQSNGY